jgi:hypothetical protein
MDFLAEVVFKELGSQWIPCPYQPCPADVVYEVLTSTGERVGDPEYSCGCVTHMELSALTVVRKWHSERRRQQ